MMFFVCQDLAKYVDQFTAGKDAAGNCLQFGSHPADMVVSRLGGHDQHTTAERLARFCETYLVLRGLRYEQLQSRVESSMLS